MEGYKPSFLLSKMWRHVEEWLTCLMFVKVWEAVAIIQVKYNNSSAQSGNSRGGKKWSNSG